MHRERGFDVLIIGAGVVGCFIARELSLFDLKIGVVEKSSYAAGGQTKANGGIVHGGHDPEPGTLKARLNVEGNAAFPTLCAGLGVRFERTGIYVVALDGNEEKALDRLLDRGVKNGVPGLSIVGSREIREREPNLSEKAVAALSIPSGGIVDVVRLALALADHSAVNGAEYFFGTEVTGVLKEGRTVVGVETDRGRFSCTFLVNCAGVDADAVTRMAGYERFSIRPRKGEYYILDKSLGRILSRPCFPVPSPHGKGILLFPTVDGNAIIGGDSVQVSDRGDTSTTAEGFSIVRRGVRRLVPRIIDGDAVIAAFSGIRATSGTGDFFIGEAEGAERLLNVAGIASPGLSASPAIASHAVSLLARMGLPLKEGAGKRRAYRPPALFKDASDAEKEELLRRDAGYARVVCRCEGITEGDIAAAVRAPLPARTLDAIKFRTRAGAGRCQGAFDLTRILKILSMEGMRSPLELEKNETGSRILRGGMRS